MNKKFLIGIFLIIHFGISIDAAPLAEPQPKSKKYFNYKLNAALFAISVVETFLLNAEMNYLGLPAPVKNESAKAYIVQVMSHSFPTVLKLLGIKGDDQITKIPWYEPTSGRSLGACALIMAQNYAILSHFCEDERPLMRARDAFLIAAAAYITGYLLYFGYALSTKIV